MSLVTPAIIATVAVNIGAYMGQHPEGLEPCQNERVLVHHEGAPGYNFTVSQCEFKASNGKLVRVE